MKKTKRLWLVWAVTSLVAVVVLSGELLLEPEKEMFLPGPVTHGHHQIELQCNACHTEGFNAARTLQNACISCHGEELEEAQDSHPKSKFTNPRNVALVQKIDARQCIACHVEHRPELVEEMGVTQPADVCRHCHEDIAEDRPSHEGMGFETCQSAGCHNFHDNRALYEDFLLAHANEPMVHVKAERPQSNYLQHYMEDHELVSLLSPEQVKQQVSVPAGQSMPENFAHTKHAAAGLDCMSCHAGPVSGNKASPKQEWIKNPGHQVCASCHEKEVSTFLKGKHGMRIGQGLSAMTPAQGKLNFHIEKAHQELTCNSCHEAHEFNTGKAAVDKCIGCHNDEHSNEYLRSPHYQLWQKERTGQLPKGAGVTCATCHMPRISISGKENARNYVDHNQNANLRPNEKMLRPVCMNCHGLEFSIDALADPELIENNFNGEPSVHIESVDMAIKRDKQRGSRSSLYE